MTATLGRSASRPRGLGRLRLRVGGRSRFFDGVVVGALVLLAILAVFGSLLAPYDPYLVDLSQAYEPPGPAHWFGTDDSGRDILSRILAGARDTLASSAVVGVTAAVIGVAVAAVAAVSGRVIDEIVMRVCDIVLAVPSLVLALGIAMALGPSLQSAVVALILASWPGTARVARSVMHTTMTESYVEAARSMGATRRRVMLQHVVPNSIDVVLVHTAFDIGGLTLVIAGLSFVGVGAQPPSAEWGAMVTAGRNFVLTSWWITVFPGLAITFAVTVFALFGEVLQARLGRAGGAR